MCRLTAYLGHDLPADHLVYGGTHSLLEQSYLPRELLSGCVNADGYGVVWYPLDAPVRVGDTRPIWQDEDLRGLLAATPSRLTLAAVRSATPGIPVDASGTPPLVHGHWSFVLNGYVEDFRNSYMRTLRSLLPDDLYGQLRGSSDSETLFFLAVAAIRDGAEIGQALDHVQAVVAQTLNAGHQAQLTMVLADGHSLAALRGGSLPETNSLYVASGHPDAPRGTLLASERLDEDPSWEPVEAHQVLRLDLEETGSPQS